MNTNAPIKKPFALVPSAVGTALGIFLGMMAIGAVFALGTYLVASRNGTPLTINDYLVDSVWKALFSGAIVGWYGSLTVAGAVMAIYSWSVLTQWLRVSVNAGDRRWDFYVSYCAAIAAALGLTAFLGVLHMLITPAGMIATIDDRMSFGFRTAFSLEETAFDIQIGASHGWTWVAAAVLFIAIFALLSGAFATLYLHNGRTLDIVPLVVLLIIATVGLGFVFEQGLVGYLATTALVLFLTAATWWGMRRAPLIPR